MDQAATVYFFVFLLSLAILYDQITRRIPTRLHVYQAPKSRCGLVLASGHKSPARAYGIDIIFVHGLGSNPDTTWRARKQTTTNDPEADKDEYINWVADFLPDDLLPHTREDIRLFFYNYESYWKRDAVDTRLWNLGSGLLEHVKTEIRRSEEEQSRYLIFVGYSYGGLVIKRALILASKSQDLNPIAEHTKAVFFLGTPHRGSNFDRLGWLAAQALRPLGSNTSLLAEVEYDSKPLLDLHREFVLALHDDLRVVNLFEQLPTLIFRFWVFQWKQFCVREQSATYEGRKVVNISVPVDHFGLNKFASRRSHAYGRILSNIIDIASSLLRTTKHHYMVPLETVQTYTPRQQLSESLEEKLQAYHENASVYHAVVIYGLGGSGKSQLALRHAEAYRSRYNPILWIDATDAATVRSSFERCAIELEIPFDQTEAKGSALTDSRAVQVVLRWLHERKDIDDEWLAIVDNADDVSWGIKKVIPKGRRGNIIVTSRDNLSKMLVDGGCERLEVGVMSPAEAQSLLLRRLNLDMVSAPENIRQGCNAVAERLGCLALAIDLAGAYISNEADQEAALMRYSVDYDNHRDELLQLDRFRGLLPTEKTIWTVWDTTLEKLQEDYANLQPIVLLTFLARFKGSIIQDEIFRLASLGLASVDRELDGDEGVEPAIRQFLQLAAEDWDSFLYRQSRDVLVRYSLVQRVEGDWPGVTMHGLVQWRAMQYEKGRPWMWWYLLFVLAACREMAVEDGRPEFRRHMLVHLPNVCKASFDVAEVPDERWDLVWTTIGRIYFDEGRWEEAESLFVQVMETRKSKLGADHPSTLTSIANLASTYSNQGRWEEAESLEVQVMETSKKSRAMGRGRVARRPILRRRFRIKGDRKRPSR